jgi:diguanylate cyclase (GGDEF)-like protein
MGFFVAVLVTVSCLLDGGATSPLVWLFPLFIAFSAAVGSRRAVTAQASSCVVGYAVVALFGQDAPPLADLALHTVYLVLAAVFAVRLTNNRIEAEERQQALTDELARLAEHDGLTGLANHRSFHQRLGATLDHAGRRQTPVALLLVDVDRFKAVNDGHGHLVGDLALQETARQLLAQARPGDVAGRVGGEEFALLLPGLDADAAWLVAERLRLAVEEGTGPVPLTVSIGVCAFPAQARSAEELLDGADTAMYRAKQTGRNRVCGA